MLFDFLAYRLSFFTFRLHKNMFHFRLVGFKAHLPLLVCVYVCFVFLFLFFLFLRGAEKQMEAPLSRQEDAALARKREAIRRRREQAEAEHAEAAAQARR